MDEEVENPQAVLAALRAAQEDLKKLRVKYDELKADADTLREAGSDLYKKRALLAEMKATLNESGVKSVDKVSKYIDIDKLDFDEDGNVTGLDETLQQLREDLPQIFDPKVVAGGKADVFAEGVVEPKVDPIRAAVRNALSN